MQTTQSIQAEQLDLIIDAVYAKGEPVVYEAYSGYDQLIRRFPQPSDLKADIQFTVGQKVKFFYYAIHYADAGGLVLEKRIELKPGAVPGFTHRFSMEGWGLVYLQCNFKDYPAVEVCIMANSRIRASNWADTILRLGAPEQWNWAVVESHTGRLIRLLRKTAK
jgi:hypothetical protein